VTAHTHDPSSGERGFTRLMVDPSTMSTSQTLQNLYSLDVSSPDIPHLLDGLIQRDEKEQHLSSLQGPELTRLVDFLDQVRALLSAFRPVTR